MPRHQNSKPVLNSRLTPLRPILFLKYMHGRTIPLYGAVKVARVCDKYVYRLTIFLHCLVKTIRCLCLFLEIYKATFNSSFILRRTYGYCSEGNTTNIA
jgi:hypothetical protein